MMMAVRCALLLAALSPTAAFAPRAARAQSRAAVAVKLDGGAVDPVLVARGFSGLASLALWSKGLPFLFNTAARKEYYGIETSKIQGTNLVRVDIGCAMSFTALMLSLVGAGLKPWALPCSVACGFFAVFRTLSLVQDGSDSELKFITVVEYLCAVAAFVVYRG